MKTNSNKQKFTYAVGKRRNAVARVRLYKGKVPSLINGDAIEKYFPGQVEKVLWEKPFRLTETSDKYYASVKVAGGGKTGQLQAAIHGVSKALAKENLEKFRPILKKAGLLTRDARIRERRKVGMGGKSRRKKQSPKR
jgi:small subunit ribosomal protein S9